MRHSKTTTRLYAACQDRFDAWRREHHIRKATHDDIAVYLRTIRRESGASAVPVHLSALAYTARKAGVPLDTKAAVIRRVVAQCRAEP